MKFLLFNVVVALGLIYLFSGDHRDIQSFTRQVSEDATKVTEKLTEKVKAFAEVQPSLAEKEAKPNPTPVVKRSPKNPRHLPPCRRKSPFLSERPSASPIGTRNRRFQT